METVIIESFKNEEVGIEATVAAYKNGFSVAIKDTDSGEYFPVSKGFKTLEAAKAHAQKAVA